MTAKLKASDDFDGNMSDCHISSISQNKRKYNHDDGKCPYGIDDNVSTLHQSVEILRTEQNNNFNHLLINISEMKDSVEKITNTILNPESGLYTRIKSVESWNGIISKVMWIVMTSAVGFLFTKVFFLK